MMGVAGRWACVWSIVCLVGCSADGAGGPNGSGTGSDGDAGASQRDEDVPTDERCGNGLDDNRDGLVDEGCSCEEGERQACWPGTPSRRGAGACRDGIQECQVIGEFMAWGPCEGAVMPGAEVEGNGIDEDCDGDAGGEACVENEFGEDCGGGFDDDCDGLVDCEDPDCASSGPCGNVCVPAEFGEDCSDGTDNDCDSRVDCDDVDCRDRLACQDDGGGECSPEFPFFVEARCGDGQDNDCDGEADCDDSDCRRPGSCGCEHTETQCSDGADGDCDGSADCTDRDCQRCTPGTFRWCDEPMYCHWGQQECQPDGSWGPCVETMERPGSCEGDLYSADCCLESGGCCQNYPVDDQSVGDCDSIVTCR